MFSVCFPFPLYVFIPFYKYLASPSSFAGIEITTSRVGTEESAQTNPDNRRHGLVYAPNATCDDFWLAWPAVQERAIARGTVVVFDLNDSVGNLFRALALLMQVRTTDVGDAIHCTDQRKKLGTPACAQHAFYVLHCHSFTAGGLVWSCVSIPSLPALEL